VRYPRLLLGFSDQAPMTSPNFAGGGYFYKVGMELLRGARVTVAIGEAASSYASLVSMFSPPQGDHMITYQSCRDTAPATAWVGGFLLHGRRTACVPLVITVSGEPHSRRVMISLGAGSCA
jgi:hypothetical protein